CHPSRTDRAVSTLAPGASTSRRFLPDRRRLYVQLHGALPNMKQPIRQLRRLVGRFQASPNWRRPLLRGVACGIGMRKTEATTSLPARPAGLTGEAHALGKTCADSPFGIGG